MNSEYQYTFKMILAFYVNHQKEKKTNVSNAPYFSSVKNQKTSVGQGTSMEQNKEKGPLIEAT